MYRTRRHLILLGAALAAPAAHGQFPGFGKKGKKEPPTRTVKGQVTDVAEVGVQAIVQIKNSRTEEVKSFHTKANGEYFFKGLDLNIDYELKAMAENLQSRTRTVSSFDSRTELIYNFRLKSAD